MVMVLDPLVPIGRRSFARTCLADLGLSVGEAASGKYRDLPGDTLSPTVLHGHAA